MRLLLGEHKQPMLLVVSERGNIQGVVTKTDILHALKTRQGAADELGPAIERSPELVEAGCGPAAR
jgi:CBS domain-containing protein